MSVAITVVLGVLVAVSLIIGLLRVSMWMTARKEAGGSAAWADSKHGNVDGYGSGSGFDGDCGDAGGGD